MRTRAASPWACSPSTRDELGEMRPRLDKAAGGVLDHAEPLHEVFRRQRGGEARGTAGGQHVVRARHVVPHHLRRVAPEKDGARAAHPREQRLRLGHRELQVLRRESVRHVHRLGEAPGEHESAVGSERARRDLPAGQGRELPGRLLLDGVEQRGGGRQQHRARHGVVLGLGEEVGGDEGGVGVRIRDHHHLARAGQHVDAHVTEHPALGQRHVDVARPHDLVHAADRLGAVGERGDRLRAAYAIRLGHAADARGRQHGGVDAAVRRGRRDQHDLPHPRYPRGHRRHEHGGGIRRRGRRARRCPPAPAAALPGPGASRRHPSCSTSRGMAAR